MKITHDNYAAYLLDYCEGTLSAADTEELMRFLDENPQYKEELEEFEHIELEIEKERFADKQSLKKRTSLTAEEFFELSEGTANAAERDEYLKIISGNRAQEKELRLWNAAKVSPDLSVVYPHREDLKRPVIVPLWNAKVFMRAAAALVVLCGSLAAYFFTGDFGSPRALQLYSSTSQLHMQRPVVNDITSAKSNPVLMQQQYAGVKEKKQQKKTDRTFISDNSVVTDSVKPVLGDSLKLAIENQPQIVTPDLTDTLENKAIASHTLEQKGVWGPEEVLTANRPGLRRRMLEFAYDCLKGLKKLGVKNAEAVKKADPESGAVDYILVLGERGIKARDE